MTTDGTDDWVARQGRYRGQADARRGKPLVTAAGDNSGAPVTVSCAVQTTGER